MPVIDENGLVVTDEDEYSEDDEYVTDDEGMEFIEEEDGEIEDVDEEADSDDDEGEEIAGIPSHRGSGGQQDVKEWESIHKLPAATCQAMEEVFGGLLRKGKREVTVLLLGKGGVGKSSTANSLLNEQAFIVTPFQQDVGRPVITVRSLGGFKLRIIDTPGLVDGDAVNERALQLIQAEAARTPVDVVLYLDRLDYYRVEAVDEAAMEAVTRVLGAEIWQRTILGLTRAQLTSPPPGTTYETFLARRLEGLQQAMQRAGADGRRPHVLIENNSKCNTNADGEKVLPDGSVWLSTFAQKIGEQASSPGGAFTADAKKAAADANPNRRKKLWIPIIFLAQIAFKVFVLDRLIEDDGIRGDEYGEFDKDIVSAERARLKAEKAAKAKQRQTELNVRTKTARSTASAVVEEEYGDEDEEEEDESEAEEESDDN